MRDFLPANKHKGAGAASVKAGVAQSLLCQWEHRASSGSRSGKPLPAPDAPHLPLRIWVVWSSPGSPLKLFLLSIHYAQLWKLAISCLKWHVIQLLHADHITCSIVITCVLFLVTVITQHSFSQCPSSTENMESFPNFLSSLFSEGTSLKVI